MHKRGNEKDERGTKTKCSAVDCELKCVFTSACECVCVASWVAVCVGVLWRDIFNSVCQCLISLSKRRRREAEKHFQCNYHLNTHSHTHTCKRAQFQESFIWHQLRLWKLKKKACQIVSVSEFSLRVLVREVVHEHDWNMNVIPDGYTYQINTQKKVIKD